MIAKASEEMRDEIRDLFKVSFPKEDPRYLDFFMKTYFKPENCYVVIQEGKIIATMIRDRHVMMFNGRAMQVSMLLGVATHPQYRHHGYMHDLMNIVLDACEHSELLTLIQTETPAMYEQFGFETIYNRSIYTISRNDVRRITNFGMSYEPAPIDLMKVYSAFIRKFNGFYARDLKDFVNYKKEVKALSGKIVAFYNGRNQIQGYAVMIPQGRELRVEELVYLDSVSLMKLCNAALQERKIVNLYVSEAEDLSLVFPHAQKRTYGSTMVRLNDAGLFTKVFNRRVTNVQQAFALSTKPLNLNEFD